MAVGIPGRHRVLGIAAWLLPVLLAAPSPSKAQSGCTYDLYASDMVGFTDFTHQGGSSFIRLETQPGCPYAVQSSDPFVRLIDDPSNPPSGVATSHSQHIFFSVAPNPGVKWRRATINIPTDAIEI